MDYLLDVNVLVAWGWADHADHARAGQWIASVMAAKGDRILTSAIPELGFVRVSVHCSRGRITPAQAGSTLEGMILTLGASHGFLEDDCSGREEWPSWCRGAGRTTDAHLLKLAEAHQAELATLDQGIPGAFLIP